VTLSLTISLLVAQGARASQQAVDFFGSESGAGSLGGEFASPTGIAVNSTGAGAGNVGDIYVLDPSNQRVQRFARDFHGTPTEPYDDTYSFVSAWGADVDASPSGGTDYEICTIATQCKSGVRSGGNGTATGNGTLSSPGGIAVDQDTGRVYVADTGNSRVNVYDGAGSFLRSFGFDVVESGSGDVAGSTEQQKITVQADGGKFSLSFKGQVTGGRGVGWVVKGSSTITKVKTSSGAFKVGQGFSATSQQVPDGTGIFPPGTTITQVGPESLTVSQPAVKPGVQETELFGDDLKYDAPAAEIQDILNALPSIGGAGGSVSVSGGPGDLSGSNPYTVTFGGSLSGLDLPSMIVSSGGLTASAGIPSAIVTEIAKGGAYEVCVAANGDVCKGGSAGDGLGEISAGAGIAVSAADGSAATGKVFLGDPENGRIDTYELDGSSPSSIGSGTFASGVKGLGQPTDVAVDSRGIVYGTNHSMSGNSATDRRIERYDSQNANGGGVGFLAPIKAPPLLASSDQITRGLAVDPDSDGPGPETDVLYAAQGQEWLQQFGPANQPGLTTPPAAADDTHGGVSIDSGPGGVAIDGSDGRLYVTGNGLFTGFKGHGVYIFGVAGGLPSASVDSVSDITSTSATIHATINPNGPPALRYHFEYSTDGAHWLATPEALLGIQETPQAIAFPLDPPGAGLQTNTPYHVRLVTKKGFGSPIVTPELMFTTLAGAPLVETTGAPVRTTATAQLGGRIDPRGTATTYRFEFGAQGPCNANPCTATTAKDAGSGNIDELVSEEIEGLEPSTTYHYRLIADNGIPGSPSFGEDMTVTTRASDAPLSHGHLPGPPESDRAYEQVNTPDTGGNPVGFALGFSDDGNRAAYEIAGGTSLSNTGSLLSLFFAERTSTGWQTKPISPPREQLVGSTWLPPVGQRDVSSLVSINTAEAGSPKAGLWRLSPVGAPTKLFEPVPPQKYANWYAAADDSPRTVALLSGGGLDPSFPTATAKNLYDVSSATPRLVSILPDGSAPTCGVRSGSTDLFQIGTNISHQLEGWVSDDGSRVFFLSSGDNCAGDVQLYVRNIDAGQTQRASKPPISGSPCPVAFIRSTPDAVFFWTQSRLVAEDSTPGACDALGPDGDVYRYTLGDDQLKCVTCVVSGLDADVLVLANVFGAPNSIAVAEDGSRVYFQSMSSTPLVPGAVTAAAGSTYRVNVETGNLRWVGRGVHPGLFAQRGAALNPDGTVLVFRSDDPSLNPLGGSDNGGRDQYYRYDDRDRSLVCISCPQDRTPASAAASVDLLLSLLEPQVGPNLMMLADDGTVAFSTPTPLVSADQNSSAAGGKLTTGEDVYEWRDGQQLLVSDGLTSWPSPPSLQGISHDGRNIYFAAAAQYTADALDGYQRLYDARIGGGFEFPPPPPPCPLEVCQGTPKGAPEEPAAGTQTFSGPGNLHVAPKPVRCGKNKRKAQRKGRTVCVKRHRPPHKRQKTRKANSRRVAR
jgi:hypothetical protein